MNMLAPRLQGSHWLDLCCGSGVMACEALRHGAALVVGIEQDRRIAQVARANLALVASGLEGDCQHWDLQAQEVLQWLRRPAQQRFDLIYCDPPYRSGLYGPVAKAIAAGDWLAVDGLLLWECASTALPPVPEGWVLERERRYGSTTVLLLSRRAGCRGDTGSRPP